MGHRHILISDVGAPHLVELPKWFHDKYQDTIDFGGKYWSSLGEHKRSGKWLDLESDVQKLLIELNHPYLELVFFADENLYMQHDIIHVLISQEEVHTYASRNWDKGEPY